MSDSQPSSVAANPSRPPCVLWVGAAGETGHAGLDQVEACAQLMRASDEEAFRELAPRADILLVTDFRTPLIRDTWPAAAGVDWVHCTSAGVDAVLFEGVIESGIRVTNARGLFDEAIAESVLGHVLAFAKDLPGTFALQRERRWQHRDSERIAGRHALVVGAGSIGRAVARLLTAAGLQVEGMASREREGDAQFRHVYPVSALHERLRQADYVILTVPLTPATEHLIDAAALAALQPGARLINVARGPVVDTAALVAALQRGQLAGAALDVFEQEPLPPEHPLWDLPNVILTAHQAGDFHGWREALIEQFLHNLRLWRRGERLHNLVDKQRGYAAR